MVMCNGDVQLRPNNCQTCYSITQCGLVKVVTVSPYLRDQVVAIVGRDHHSECVCTIGVGLRSAKVSSRR